MHLHERLSALELSSVPTWVFDADYFRQRWANRAALELWKAKTPEELYARDYSDMSASARARMQGYIEGFGAGRNAEEQWTLYPKGEPKTMKLFLSGIPLDDGRVGVLIQAFEVDAGATPDLVRSIEALRHASLMVTLIDFDKAIVMQNPAAIHAFGSTTPFIERYVDQAICEEFLATTHAGQLFRTEALVKTEAGSKWHEIEARALQDPATGSRVVLVQHMDVTARRHAEDRAEIESRLAAELRRTLTIVEEQKAQIIVLSAPILEFSKTSIVVPIIGTLDEKRTSILEQRILAYVAHRGTRSVILDLTGIDVSATAEIMEQLVRLGRAIRLLGARTFVTGIMSTVARTLVSASVDMGELSLLRSLREGIRAAERHDV
jgi:rsbT co-antagonist protein RsbR